MTFVSECANHFMKFTSVNLYVWSTVFSKFIALKNKVPYSIPRPNGLVSMALALVIFIFTHTYPCMHTCTYMHINKHTRTRAYTHKHKHTS